MSRMAGKSEFLYLLRSESIVSCRYSSDGERSSDRTKAGSSLRHWPPGTNSKTFVPPFFLRRTPKIYYRESVWICRPRLRSVI
jgi:hypothetical protein